jgi:hypothetical protein
MAIRRDIPERGPERLGEILSRLFTARGWGRRQERLRLEQAWAEAAGPEHAAHTRAERLRRGVLDRPSFPRRGAGVSVESGNSRPGRCPRAGTGQRTQP